MPNRLITQTSPYLLQHAHNPVDWWPWGEEAFAEARRRDVPIFLSIGYSTCYWCHVMERESFENAQIGRAMSERFVCIKVDREERPDIDDLYMAAVVMMTGQGGWPMSVFLEPEKLRPFWCGTYFPAEPMPGLGNRPTFPQVIESLSKAWVEQRAGVIDQATQVAGAVAEHFAAREAPQVGSSQVSDAVSSLLKMFDRVHGGFGGAPKFPQPVFLEFLLDVRGAAEDDATRDAIDAAARRTLDAMALGGIRDHVGGGFHRYAVDAQWLVPHFEKMLYDNAQLAGVYARASRLYADSFYADVARSTLAYVAREMTSADGAFFSAQDAEVDGREGFNYLWMPPQIDAAIGDADLSRLARDVYGVGGGPNFRDPHHPDEPPANILFLTDRPENLARRLALSAAALEETLGSINAALYAARRVRKQPRLDDKVLTAWNALMISALAQASVEFADDSLLTTARRAAGFVLSHLSAPDGRLLRSWRAGRAEVPGVLEDYAMFIAALLALHRARRDDEMLGHAVRLLGIATRDFADGAGGWFDARADRTDLFVRARSTHDGALPSASSVMIHNLLDLHELTGDEKHKEAALRAIAASAHAIAQSPVGAINATRGLYRALAAGAPDTAAPQGPRAAAPGARADFTPVEIYASVERVTVSAAAPGVLTLLFRIADGYHIVAADSPGQLIPLRVGIIGGTGVTAYADYPAGEAYGPDAIRVHRGTFEMNIVLELGGEWNGRPLVSVAYQACSETECLGPMTVELDVAIDRG